MTFNDGDIELIKSMGFDHVKLLVTPATFLEGPGINPAHMWYVEEVVNRVVKTGLPVVV